MLGHARQSSLVGVWLTKVGTLLCIWYGMECVNHERDWELTETRQEHKPSRGGRELRATWRSRTHEA